MPSGIDFDQLPTSTNQRAGRCGVGALDVGTNDTDKIRNMCGTINRTT